MSAGTTSDLISDAKRVIRWPDVSDLTDEEILRFGDEAIQSIMAAVMKVTADEWFIQSTVIPLIPNTFKYRLPLRVMARAVRSVLLQYPDGTLQELNYIDLVRLQVGASFGNGSSPSTSNNNTYIPNYYSLESDSIVLATIPPGGYSLKVSYQMTPSDLVVPQTSLRIASVPSTDPEGLGRDGKQLILTGDSVAIFGGQVFDIVSGRDPHTSVIQNLVVAQWNSSLKLVTFTEAVDSSLIYTSPVVTGGVPDYISGAGTTPYPQVPKVMWTALINFVGTSILESVADPRANVQGVKATQALKAALEMMVPRDQTRSERIIGVTTLRTASRGYRRGGWGNYNGGGW